MNSRVFFNANIITMEQKKPTASAIFIKDGVICAIGSDDYVISESDGAEKVDLKGRTVVPGLFDCHVHVMGTGINLTGTDLYDCASIAEVLEKLKKSKEENKKSDAWIFGKRLDESRLKEKRPPTAKELDDAVGGSPVYIADRGLHYSLINTAASKIINVSKDVPGYGATGRMHDKANGLARRGFLQFMDDDQRKAAARRVCEIAASKGVTTIGAMEGGQWGSEADVDAIISSKLPCDVLVYWDTFDIEAAKAKGLTRIGADITLDGSIGSRTAAFEEPYADAPDRSGVLYYDAKQITQYIYDCYENNLQTGFHVIGRLAIKQALDCLEEAGVGTRHRLRMEHFGYPTDEDIERCAKLGAVISTQSAFTYFRGGPGSVYLERLGAERERNGYPLRKFLNAGIIVGNGSDSDVTPIDPILGIYAAVNPPYPENAITPYEALKAATIDAAYISGEETKKGSLAVGKLGDLTVLDADILKNLNKNINVFATIKNGEYAYGGN